MNIISLHFQPSHKVNGMNGTQEYNGEDSKKGRNKKVKLRTGI